MRRIAAEDEGTTESTRIVLNYAHAVSGHSNLNDMWREFAERVLRPCAAVVLPWLEALSARWASQWRTCRASPG